MTELIATLPLGTMPPLTIGTLTLAQVDLGPMASIAPFKGRENALSAVLMAAHGLTWVAPGRSVAANDARLIWFGLGVTLLTGVAPDAGVQKCAAVTDQSDAWACVTLEGRGVEDALAKLVPIDLRLPRFAVGATARTKLVHLNVSITREAEDRFLIMAFRSMAETLKHDIVTAMESRAAAG